MVGYGDHMVCHEGLSALGPLEPLALLRKEQGCLDSDSNSDDFVIGPADPRSSASPNVLCFQPLTGIGEANPFTVWEGLPVVLSVAVTPATYPRSTGIRVMSNFGYFGGPAELLYYDDGTNGDSVAGDLVYSARFVFPATNWDDMSVLVTAEISDAQGRSEGIFIFLHVIRPPTATRPATWGSLKRSYR